MVKQVTRYEAMDGRVFLTEGAALRHDAVEAMIRAIPELGLIRIKLEGNLNAMAPAIARLARFMDKPPVFPEVKTTLGPDHPGYPACAAVQHGDMTECKECILVWDTNDPAPPPCNRVGRYREPEDTICDCGALMSGELLHSPTCIAQTARRLGPLDLAPAWMIQRKPERDFEHG